MGQFDHGPFHIFSDPVLEIGKPSAFFFEGFEATVLVSVFDRAKCLSAATCYSAGFGDIFELAGKFQQSQLVLDKLFLDSHGVLSRESTNGRTSRQAHATQSGRSVHRPTLLRIGSGSSKTLMKSR